MDETKPDEVIIPKIVDADPPPLPERITRKGMLKLENLPENIKKDLHELISRGFKSFRCKKVLEDRWVNKTTFLPASIDTYDAYIKRFGPEILERKNIQKNLLQATKEGLEDTRHAVASIANEDMALEDKKQIFTQLFVKCSQRVQLIESYNTTSGFINPQFETVLTGYLKEQRSILETIIKLQNELNKADEVKTYHEMENLFYMCFVPIINVYKELHGDALVLEFKSKAQDAIVETLKAYKDNRENPQK